jgi:hypothetical protein
MLSGLKGTVKLELVDSLTGKIKKTIQQDNLIVDNLFNLFFNNSSDSYSTVNIFSDSTSTNTGASNQIFISSSTSNPLPTVANTNSLPEVFARATPNNVTEVYSWSNHTIDYIEYYRQFANPGGDITREVNTVGLLRVNTSNLLLAYLKLNETCIQGPNDFLNVYYRIQASVSADVHGYADLGQAMANYHLTTSFSRSGAVSSGLHTLPLPRHPSYGFARAAWWHGNESVTVGSALYYPAQYTKVYTFQYSQALPLLGKILRSYAFCPAYRYSRDARPLVWEDFTWPSEPIFQGMFGHSANANGPFFSATESQGGTGKVLMTGSWNKDLPEIYKILITQSGSATTATYRWAKRSHLGFVGNTFSLSAPACPYFPDRNPNRGSGYGLHQLRTAFRYYRAIRYDDRTLLTWFTESPLNTTTQKQGVTLTDVLTGNHVDIGPDETIHLPVVDIAQVSVDGQMTSMTSSTPSTRILVACRVTGLWEVIPATEQVFHRSSTPCYGVDIGHGGKVIAAFEGRISSSDDYSSPLPFNYAGVSDDNWSRIRYLKVDPQSSTFQTGLVINSPLRIIWWSTDSENAITGPTTANQLTEVDVYSNYKFECSSVDSVWCHCNGSTLYHGSFGHTGGTALGSVTRVRLIGTAVLRSANLSTPTARVDTSVNTSYLNVDSSSINSSSSMYFTDILTGTTISYDPDTQTTRDTINFVSPKLYIGENDNSSGAGYLSNWRNAMVIKPWGHPSHPDYWDEYGWDGSNWVRDHLGSKACHTGPQTLDGGINVHFENGEAGTSFVATDYYTQCCSKGVMKDNATTLGFRIGITSRPSYKGVALPAELTVPVSAPYEIVCPSAPNGSSPHSGFIQMLNVLPQLFALTLNSSPVTESNLILHDALSNNPSAGQVKVGANVFIFNAADAGKSFGGTYSFVSRS